MKRREALKPLPDFKVCCRCLIEKPKDCFRVRVQDKKYRYLNATCRQCDNSIAKELTKKRSPEQKAKNAARTRAYYAARRDEHNAKQKEKRKTPQYKAYMKEYRRRRKEIIHEQEVITKRRYHEKNKNPITDKYVINRLGQEGIKNPTQEEIELRRAKILIHRIKQKIDKKMIGVSKVCSICKIETDLSQFWKVAKNSKKRVSFCKACGADKNKKQKDERHSKFKKSLI